MNADQSSREHLVEVFETFNPSYRNINPSAQYFEEVKINEMIREFTDENDNLEKSKHNSSGVKASYSSEHLFEKEPCHNEDSKDAYNDVSQSK